MDLDYTVNIQYDDFRTQIMSVEELLRHCDKVGFPRMMANARRISAGQRSRIVEALLLGVPQQPLFVDDTEQKWMVIDGAARMDAIYSFCRSGMPLTSLFFKMDKYEGKTFDSLSLFERTKLLNTKIVVHALNPGISPQERFGIYICLKPRIDAAALKWCRSRIFVEPYRLVEELAEKIGESLPLRPNRTDAIENRICHLLVGSGYRHFLDSHTNHHMDAVVNSLLGSSDFPLRMKELSAGIEDTLKVTCRLPASELPVRYRSLYDSVFYHVRSSGIADSFQEKFWQLLEQGRDSVGFSRPEDSAENLCDKINEILKQIEYAYPNHTGSI